MGKWEMVRLGDVCEILDSHRIPITASKRKAGNYPYYGANGVQDYVSDYIFDDELVLLAEDGGNFGSKEKPIAYRVSGKCWVNNHAHVLKAKQCLNTDYLCRSIMFYDVSKLISGTTRAKLNQAAMRKILIPLPPLDEQKRIAKNLDLASEIVKGYKEQLAELDKLVQSVFYEMFGDPVTNEKGWEIKYIDELYEIIDGDRGINYPKQEEFLDEGYCLFLNAGNVTKKGFVFENVQFIPRSKDKLLRKGKLQRDDIVLTTRGTVGNLAHYTENIPFDNVRINSGMVILRKFAEIEHNYFLAYFSNPLIYTSLMSGSAQPQLPITNMRRAKVVYPPIPLQTRFASIVTEIENQKAQIQQALTQAENLFNSLMQEYFE